MGVIFDGLFTLLCGGILLLIAMKMTTPKARVIVTNLVKRSPQDATTALIFQVVLMIILTALVLFSVLVKKYAAAYGVDEAMAWMGLGVLMFVLTVALGLRGYRAFHDHHPEENKL